MNAFSGFVKKEFLHILRDRRTLVILIGMPLAQLLLFGFVIRNEVREIRVAIVDPAQDAVTRAVKDRLIGTGYFRLVALPPQPGAIHRAFQAGLIDQALVFERAFGRRLDRTGTAEVQIIMDATDPNTARLMLAYTQAVLQDVQRAHLTTRPTAQRPASAGGGIEPVVRMRYNPEMKSIYVFVPGLMAFILMLICALMTSITISREKERGTMEVLLVSPLQPLQIVVGKVVPYLVLSFLNVVTILALARLVFGVPVQGNVALLLAESLLFILAALALGVLISTRTQSQLTAMMISLAGLMLPTLLLSGFIFPISSMPWPLQTISHIVPAKWFLIIVKGIMLKGAGLDALWRESLILIGMTVAFIGISVRRLNIRLE